ncbi:hypothetical protein [Povalibacter sp.]|uniref:hypothetical protein n=1 Tax=Povalibacter sp. TaxID=1962978 RepID=UPI002F3F04D7
MRDKRMAMLAAALVGLIDVVTAAAHTDDPPPALAIWRVQQLPFEYSSAQTFYACDSLRQKVQNILQQVGAHRSVQVTTRCSGRPTSQISASIAVATPVEATDENIAQATTFSPEARLVAHLRKVTLPTPRDLARFQASWQTVSLSRGRGRMLDSGDCGLWRSLREQIFPRIAVRIVRDRINCSGSASRIQPDIEVQALIPALDESPVL